MGLFSSSKSSSQSTPGAPQQPPTGSSGSSNQVTSQPSSSRAPPGTGQHRPIFLLIWPSALFKAHWAIFVPEAGDKTFKKGKYIHVEGNLGKGFQFRIVRGWDLNLTRNRPNPPIEIGWLRSDLIIDTPTNGTLMKEAVTRDQLEAILAAVPAPSQSLNSVSNGESSSGKGKKVELSDCQWWVTRCIHHLVENGFLIAPPKGLNKNKDPREIIRAAPRH